MDTVLCEEDLHLLCRVCLNGSYNYCNIYEEYLRDNYVYEVLNDVCQLDVMVGDGLPIYLCCDCRDWLADFESFKRTSYVGNSTLRRLKAGLKKVRVEEEIEQKETSTEEITFGIKKEVEEETSVKYVTCEDVEESVQDPAEENVTNEDGFSDFIQDDRIEIEEHSPDIKIEREDGELEEGISEECVNDVNAGVEPQEEACAGENVTNVDGGSSEDGEIDVEELSSVILTDNEDEDFIDLTDGASEDYDDFSIISGDYGYPSRLNPSRLCPLDSNTQVLNWEEVESERLNASDSNVQVFNRQEVVREGSCALDSNITVLNRQEVESDRLVGSNIQVLNRQEVESDRLVGSNIQVLNRQEVESDRLVGSNIQVLNRQEVESDRLVGSNIQVLNRQEVERERLVSSNIQVLNRQEVESDRLVGSNIQVLNRQEVERERLGASDSNIQVSNRQDAECKFPPSLLPDERKEKQVHWQWKRKIVKVSLPGYVTGITKPMQNKRRDVDVHSELEDIERELCSGRNCKTAKLEPVKDGVAAYESVEKSNLETCKSLDLNCDDKGGYCQTKPCSVILKRVPVDLKNNRIVENREFQGLSGSHTNLELYDALKSNVNADLESAEIVVKKKRPKIVPKVLQFIIHKLPDFKCNECGKEFITESELIIHRNTHIYPSNPANGIQDFLDTISTIPVVKLDGVSKAGSNTEKGIPVVQLDSVPKLGSNIVNGIPVVKLDSVPKLRNDTASAIPVVKLDGLRKVGSSTASGIPVVKLDSLSNVGNGTASGFQVVKLDSLLKLGNKTTSSIPVVKLDSLSNVGNSSVSGIPVVKLDSIPNVGEDGAERALTLVCSVCNKLFNRKDQLELHMRFHMKKKGLQCSYCSKKFILKNNLTNHEKVHLEEANHPKIYPCYICGKCFSKPLYLRKHVKTHTLKNPLQCLVCLRMFGSRDDLKEHILIHVNKPYQCGLCHATFIDKKTLLMHEGTITCKR